MGQESIWIYVRGSIYIIHRSDRAIVAVLCRFSSIAKVLRAPFVQKKINRFINSLELLSIK